MDGANGDDPRLAEVADTAMGLALRTKLLARASSTFIVLRERDRERAYSRDPDARDAPDAPDCPDQGQ